MMQMFGFRGASSSSSSSASSSSSQSLSPRSDPRNPNQSPKPSPIPPSTAYTGPARPLRLVYCDDKGKFQMDPEAVAALQLVKGPIGVVSVCGRARQGKSFILNQLLGRSSGFKVASTHRPCTKGLWMWSAPLKRSALDGTEFNLLLLDSEGIDAYDQTGTYSTQIFSLAVLLSSMFIYNQMGGIDEAALDRLSLVTEVTKHIRVRASGGKTTASELSQFSPVFVWLLRDFYLDLNEDNRKISPRDYLELALRPMQGGTRDVSAKNEIRESIRALFPDRECFPLVRPLNNEVDLQRLDQLPLDRLRPEFRSGLDALTRFVFERTRPKQVGATVMTGPILAGITQSFLDAINNGAVPTISSSWQGTYSTQIFSLAVLLSSMFIYNQMGGIDEAALDRLSLVTEVTKHIRVRASGGKTTASELSQFSPVFVWLLRDFYLDLNEDNRKISPRDYLELALRPMQGGTRDVSAKNEIRESIRALFPDRECFPLVRPLNNEVDLQRLDQLPLDRLRPEFRSGLDALTRFVFERTRPKQVGATVMTGPILAGITQSFLDAINNGAVPTISSSWQNVEEAECRRAYDAASEAYMSSFDRSKPADEALLREAHEVAVQKALAIFNSSAVGSGSARANYEKLLHNFVRKAFEDYKKNVFLEAEIRCSNAIQSMETKLRAACHVPGAKIDNVVQILDSLLTEYESSYHGPGKWKKLAVFLQQCLEGPLLDLFKRQLDHIELERNALRLKCTSNEDKLGLLNKKLEANEKHRAEYLKRYEEAINDKQKISEDYSGHVANLKGKCSTLEERCLSLSKALDNLKRESSDWKSKFDNVCSEQKSVEEKYSARIASLESRISANEGRLAAAREQAESAQEEALEWKRKYDVAVGEAKTALGRAALAQERTNKVAQEREDILRAEFSDKLTEKEEEIKLLCSRLEHNEKQANSLNLQLEVAQSKLKSHELETSALKEEMDKLIEKFDSVKSKAESHEKEMRILEQEKNHLQEKYLSECKKYDEAETRHKDAEREAKRAIEMADAARTEVLAAQKEKNEAHRLAMERSTLIERAERQVESLEREKAKLTDEVDRLRSSEMEAMSKVTLLERRVDEREREIEVMLSQNNEQRSNTVQVLEGLLATERAARAEANRSAEFLSLQLQATQGKLDMLQQELTSVRLNETALDSKLKASQGKRLRGDDNLCTESVHDMDIDEAVGRGKKRSKSTTSPLKFTRTEDGGSVFKGGEDRNHSQDNEEATPEDHTRLTMTKLKQELTKQGFGAQVLQFRTPSKKDLIALYEKHILRK